MSELKFNSWGEDVRVHESARIKYPDLCKIGSHVAIDNGATISTEIEIGDYVHIAPYFISIGGKKSKVIFKDFSGVAARVTIVAGSENYSGEGMINPTIPEKYRDLVFTTVTLGRFAIVGINSSIMTGVTMGEGSILGAHSLLTKDAEDWTIYVGVPAKPIKIRRKEKILEYAKLMGY